MHKIRFIKIISIFILILLFFIVILNQMICRDIDNFEIDKNLFFNHNLIRRNNYDGI